MQNNQNIKEVFPLTIVFDRYGGIYSNGKYTSWNLYPHQVPKEINSNDITCMCFWDDNKIIVGIGNTPNEANNDLIFKLNCTHAKQLDKGN